jgi:hypothetical protein
MENVAASSNLEENFQQGSEKALRFFYRTLNQLSKQTSLIEKSFTPGITMEERIIIINALEEQKLFAPHQGIEPIAMVKRILYDSINNKITIIANPEYHSRLKEAMIKGWRSRNKTIM